MLRLYIQILLTGRIHEECRDPSLHSGLKNKAESTKTVGIPRCTRD